MNTFAAPLLRYLLVLLLVLGCGVAAAAPARIAMVLWRGETEVERGFRAALAEQGVEATIEIFDIERDTSRLPAIVRKLREAPPDLVYTWGTSVTLGIAGRWDAPPSSSAKYLSGVPILFVMVAAPFDTGVAPAAPLPPRAGLTGVSHIAPLEAQINAIRSYLPLKKLGIVFNPNEANSVSNVEALRDLAASMGYTLLEAPVPPAADGEPSPAAIPALVAGLAKQGAQVLYIGPDNFVGNYRETLTSAGIAHGLPTFTATELEIRDGEAMFGLVSRYEQVGRLAALKARAILVAHTPPAELPVETLERFTYLIRLPVARRLHLYPPLQLLRYAEIIK